MTSPPLMRNLSSKHLCPEWEETLITIGMDPILARIGSLTIAWHGVLMSLGIIVGVLLTLYLSKRAGISPEAVLTIAFWSVLFAVLGARLVHVLDQLDYYSHHLRQIPAFWEGGLAWYGGLIFGILAMIISARLLKVPLGRFADAGAPSVMLGLAIGRIGCTINGDVFGRPTSLPWGIAYTNPGSYPAQFGLLGVATQPIPIYEIIWCLIIVGILWWLRKRLKPEGSLFLVMVALYSFGRFFLSWLRAEQVEAPILGPLHESHILSIIMFVVAIGLLAYMKVSWAKPDLAESVAIENKSDDT
jgi:phosphatidylglycerol:prolipoprotein diacylglycerol transferase